LDRDANSLPLCGKWSPNNKAFEISWIVLANKQSKNQYASLTHVCWVPTTWEGAK
jgi:hypothetical protein